MKVNDMKTKFFVLLISWLFVANCFAQKFDAVIIDSTMKYFFVKKDSSLLTQKMPLIYKLNLIDSSDKKTVAVYFFRLMSSTSLPYLCLRDANGTVTIIEHYYIDDCLEELLNFYKLNNNFLTVSEKIQCTEQALKVIKTWQKWFEK